VIGALLLIVLQDLAVAGVALAANIIPIAVLFGIVGWIGMPLDAATVCVASLSLGIAVDDTIHVVLRIQDAYEHGRSGRAAIHVCFETILPALVATTVTIAVGFGILGFAEISLVKNLGLMMAGAALICLAADTLLLPALMLRRTDSAAS
jgi:predicted RND superfamily exporter protein